MSTHPRSEGADYIIGSDEVGTGAWAGPLFVCALAAPKSWDPPKGLTDSKKLSPEDRLRYYKVLESLPLVLMRVENTEIDRVGMKTALLTAHTTAIAAMLKWFRRADAVIDGVLRLPELPQVRAVAHADAIFPAVSAASIIAKVNRDYVMRQYSLIYPGYGFDSNVGYHASTHVRGLAEQGVCALHRRSYAPIKRILGLL